MSNWVLDQKGVLIDLNMFSEIEIQNEGDVDGNEYLIVGLYKIGGSNRIIFRGSNKVTTNKYFNLLKRNLIR